MRHLLGHGHAPSREQLPENAIIVARSMGPAALLDYDRKRLRGLVLEEGGPTSHVAIVARALGIAAVGEVSNAIGLVDPGDAIIVDGAGGDIHIRPSPDLEAAYIERVRVRARRQLQYYAVRDKPCVTRDGEEISLFLNAGLLVDLPHLAETGAAGIGLFRTELQFMVAAQFPRTGRATRALPCRAGCRGRPAGHVPHARYRRRQGVALHAQRGRKRTPRSDGARSGSASTARRCCAARLRALLRAASGRELKVMFPMVAAVKEFEDGKELVERELTYLRRHGHKLPERVEVGTMLEVPSLLYQLDELLDRVDFFSVGSNDLMQFLFAADRGNPRVSARFDELSIPMLRALKDIADHGYAHGKPVTLCGEMASKTLSALALIAIGYRKLSAGSLGGRAGQGDGDGASCRQGASPGECPDRAQEWCRLDSRKADGLRGSRGHPPVTLRSRLSR